MAVYLNCYKGCKILFFISDIIISYVEFSVQEWTLQKKNCNVSRFRGRRINENMSKGKAYGMHYCHTTAIFFYLFLMAQYIRINPDV